MTRGGCEGWKCAELPRRRCKAARANVKTSCSLDVAMAHGRMFRERAAVRQGGVTNGQLTFDCCLSACFVTHRGCISHLRRHQMTITADQQYRSIRAPRASQTKQPRASRARHSLCHIKANRKHKQTVTTLTHMRTHTPSHNRPLTTLAPAILSTSRSYLSVPHSRSPHIAAMDLRAAPMCLFSFAAFSC